MHAWNGTWGVIAVGAFADADLITNSYGTDVFSGGQRPYGFLFPGGGGHLLGAQIAYALFIAGALQLASHAAVAWPGYGLQINEWRTGCTCLCDCWAPASLTLVLLCKLRLLQTSCCAQKPWSQDHDQVPHQLLSWC